MPTAPHLAQSLALTGVLLSGCQADLRVPACFPGDVLVATPAGDVPIGALGTGDRVWSVDLDTGRLVAATVRFRWDTFTTTLVEVTAEGAAATTTPTHPFRDAVTERWVRAGDLDPGHAVMVRDRDLVVSLPVEVTAERAVPLMEVHSLAVEGPHGSFVAGGFVVGQ